MEKAATLCLKKFPSNQTTCMNESELNNEIENSKDTYNEKSEIDGRVRNKNEFASKKIVAEGMMDIALLTANANQLRFLITYNNKSKTYFINMSLIILSLILQVAIGIALIFKRYMKNNGKRHGVSVCSIFMVVGIFIVTVINVFVAAFTTTDSIINAD